MDTMNPVFHRESLDREEAIKLLQSHGMSQADFNTFFKELGSKQEYKSKDIRTFLGY